MKTSMPHIEKAEQLLYDYTPESSFFLASSNHTLLANGVFTCLRDDAMSKYHSLQEQVHAALDKAKRYGLSENPLVVGAIPFNSEQQAYLKVPLFTSWSDALPFKQMTNILGEAPVSSYTIKPVPLPEEYEQAVNQGLKRISTGELKKIVLSRSLEVKTEEKVNIRDLLYRLAMANPDGYTFAVNLNDDTTLDSGQRALIGASPELLISKNGLKVTANPLAGSAPRSHNPDEDAQRSSALLKSVKDRHEHAVVVDSVVEALKPFCKSLHVPEEPSLLHTKTMWHLSSVIEGTLASEEVTSLQLAQALHPTPAVCGTPTITAKKAIQSIEPFDRGLFTGMVGWNDSRGDGEWVVTIRCAEVADYSLKLFAGAGIVNGSTPEGELAETSAKFQTMLQAIGMSRDEAVLIRGRKDAETL
ncbi:isochorismate synthase DhbC [Salipaludibacillus agaradhaerens]|uniref:isochorismate synthase n=1 Tax=Salipaludibacillus agaradhaerens TaxID=76935 RepID=A0A9Q4G0Q2_SALAG|nr:isochorismate synthase DhbC [Salipaludibacillus agaradhaerens]MCR6098059.1 isochorismate synthase DhbC [Salipaludibacillus agaradhaerens]MCR6116312.1 isochorismate synthase DhbC [Salipaludibacillus agaradhaerens]